MCDAPRIQGPPTPEHRRLAESPGPDAPWRRWGPYVSARQWGTVREDYSADGDAWRAFPFDHAHLRAYRWGEDGLAGLCDRFGFLNLTLALWNERDDRLKERLFGLTAQEASGRRPWDVLPFEAAPEEVRETVSAVLAGAAIQNLNLMLGLDEAYASDPAAFNRQARCILDAIDFGDIANCEDL